jgi:ABC-type nitrate/sulfonate/bicarbonate transport system substrate-binding protein
MGGESWTVAFVPEGNPLDLALGTAPLLQHVERCMSKASGVRAGTRLDMRFYRTQTQAVAALAVGEVDFVEMNAREYVRARSQSPGARLLARPVPSIAAGTWGGGPSVLFTRAGTGINTLSDLRGRSFLFGATDSTLTFWAKVYLEKAGIHAGDLARYRYLDRPENLTGGGSNRGSASRGKPLGNPFSEMTAVAAVVDGTYDAGVATERRVLQVATREKLVVLKRFDDPGSVLVCGNKVPAPAAASFQEALTGLKDPQILQAFPGRPCRFEPCKDADFAAIASRLTPELEFDQSETQEQPSRTNDQHNSL